MVTLVATLLLAATTQAAAPLVDAKDLDERFRLDIRYATADNFTGRVLYPAAKCLLRPEVGAQLVRAQNYLAAHHPGLSLLLKDCYRPHSVQVQMWAVVKGTAQQGYVADPAKGSVHNYGAAVDVTLVDAEGHELDMGTPYDFLGRLAQPRYEAEHLKQGKLTPAQVQNRQILRAAMVQGGGFKSIPNEWWHFDALQGQALRRAYQLLDLPLDSPATLDPSAQPH